MASASEQPNFARAAEALHVLTKEVERCPNLQVSRDATTLNRIVEDMASFRQMMQSGFDTIGRKLDALEGRVGALEATVGALERSGRAAQQNIPALIYNSQIRHQGVKLAPLYSPVTGELLERTAVTLEELDNMPAACVNELLEQLGLSSRGSATVKKQRLKFTLCAQPGIPPPQAT
ncbi:KID repeat-containing protein [Metarhizium rileyi]|uniref:KID repeat-containing protein n=1 Tax=Metarhizium rileyi (strain RCEF 4871) TaxID=1649241 RepID=A0A167JH41_METRR|nr:KID repeat-containing protein [Metarhizium rileyi RCEF 4871]